MSKRSGRARGTPKRVVQEQLARERRRRRTAWTSAVVVFVLVLAGLVGWGISAGQQRTTGSALQTPGVAVDSGTGFAVGTGPVKVDVYEDFMCPICGEFEKTSAPTLTQLAAAGKVTVVYHPIAILDRFSTTAYSTRAAAAAAAAAQGGKFIEYHNVLFGHQPAENSAGLSDDTLIQLGTSVGLTDPAFATSITGKTYQAWATRVTDTASARGVTGTPTVLVAGKQVTNPATQGGPPTAQNLTAAVAAAAA